MAKEVAIAIYNTKKNATNSVRASFRRVFGTAENKIRSVFNDIRTKGYSSVQPFSVGHVEKRMQDFAKVNGIEIADGDMYMSVKGITHAQRVTKVRDGFAVSERDMEQFPSKRAQMDLFYDGVKIVYTDYQNKFIVHPNYTLKISQGKTKKVNFVTAGKAGRGEFNLPKYKRI